jgi:hypothetical protein
MSMEIPNQPAAESSGLCPVCGSKGRPVPGQTVKAMLSVSLRAVQVGEYLFCKTPTCPVVYYSAVTEQLFTVDQVCERVFQKDPQDDANLICYCFQYSVGDVRSASSDERDGIMDDIQAGIRAGQCACDLRNPQGSCCLSNIRTLIKQLEPSV